MSAVDSALLIFRSCFGALSTPLLLLRQLIDCRLPADPLLLDNGQELMHMVCTRFETPDEEEAGEASYDFSESTF